jgi:hypothetical protein
MTRDTSPQYTGSPHPGGPAFVQVFIFIISPFMLSTKYRPCTAYKDKDGAKIRVVTVAF